MKNVINLFIIVIVIFCFTITLKAQQINENLNISGFGIFHYSKTNIKDSKEIVEFHPIYLNFGIKANEKNKMVLEFEYEHLPSHNDSSIEGEIKIERAYIEYSQNDKINLQAGKFFVPAGIWLPIHWRMLTPTYDRVIFFENKTYYMPSHQTGVHYFGKTGLTNEFDLNYNVWITLGPEGSQTDKADTKFNNLGGNLKFSFIDIVDFGAAFQNIETTEDYKMDHDTILYFTQLKLINEKLIISSEYIESNLDATHGDASNYRNLYDFYTGIEYHFAHDWSIYYRYNMGDDLKRSGAKPTKNDIDPQTTINSGAITWSPFAGTQIRLEYLEYDFKEESLGVYNAYKISFGQFF